jgi:hypothetical protein
MNSFQITHAMFLADHVLLDHKAVQFNFLFEVTDSAHPPRPHDNLSPIDGHPARRAHGTNATGLPMDNWMKRLRLDDEPGAEVSGLHPRVAADMAKRCRPRMAPPPRGKACFENR